MTETYRANPSASLPNVPSSEQPSSRNTLELLRVLDDLGGHCRTKVGREDDHGPDNRQGPPIGRQPRDNWHDKNYDHCKAALEHVIEGQTNG